MAKTAQFLRPRAIPRPFLLGCAAAVALAAGPASAHPHVFVDALITPIFDAQGRLSAIHEKWKFDQTFTEAAEPDLDVNRDGILEAGEIQNAGGVGVLWFIPYGYFTRVTLAGQPVATGTVDDFAVRIPGAQMETEFTLALSQPVAAPFSVGIDVFDPEIYVAVDFAEPGIDPSHLPATCTAARRESDNLDPFAVLLIRKLGLPSDPAVINDPAAGFKVRLVLNCT